MSGNLSSLPPGIQHQLLAGPAAPPPHGVVSDLGAHNPYIAAVIAEISITYPLAIAAMLVRLYTQQFILDGLVLEDYIAIVAALLFTVADAFGVTCVVRGTGKHMWDLTLQSYINASQATWFYGIFYYICLPVIKTAILLQFIRIFSPSRINKLLWYSCWICIVSNAIVYAVTWFLILFQCTPIRKQWNPFLEGHCISIFGIYTVSGTWNMVSDIVMLLIPVPVILRLNLTTKKKMGILAFFGTGLLACVASIIRLSYSLRFYESKDSSYHSWFMGSWCSVELSCGIVIFCLPSFPRFWNFVKTTFRGSSGIAAGQMSSSSPSSHDTTAPRKSRQLYDMPSLASFEAAHSSAMLYTLETLAGHPRKDSERSNLSEEEMNQLT